MSDRFEKLQAEFAAGILGTDRAILASLKNGAGLDAELRFGIYRDAYRTRLADSLQDTYGHTATYVGHDGFRAMALEFVEAHTPSRASIRWYGEGLPEWLRTKRPEDPEIAELAALDWALRSAFDSVDAEPLQAHDLSRLGPGDWDRVGFRLHPAFHLLAMRRNTVAVWQALNDDATPPESIELDEPSMVMVWRRGLEPHFRTLDSGEDQALLILRSGGSFSGLCAELAASRTQDEAAALAGRWLRRWIGEGLLTGLTGA